MYDWLERAARSHRDRTALITPDGGVVPFHRLDAMVAAGAARLGAAGMMPGEAVGVWGRNDLDTVVALWAVPRAGGILVPFNTRLTPSEAARQAGLARLRRLVGGAEAPDLGVPRVDLLSLAQGGPEIEAVDRPETHSILFTSGTSGPPKGVVLSWANWEAAAGASAAHLDHGPEDVWLAALPLFHVGGLAILIRSARQGAAVRLEAGFEPVRVAAVLGGTVTLASLVPTMLVRLLAADTGPYRGVRAVLLGGGPIPAGLLERAVRAGLPVLPTYGMTEAASQLATLPVGEAGTARRRVRPLPAVELRVVDGGVPLPPGQAGEIQVRGPMVSRRYVGEAPRPADAWFPTGDLGVLGTDGYLEVVGRADGTIITGGENVAPAEVEAALAAHPLVRAAAVVGVPDPEWGEVVAAVVETTAVVSAEELAAFARRQLAGYKIPRRWALVDRLPAAVLGKPARGKLRALAEADGLEWEVIDG